MNIEELLTRKHHSMLPFAMVVVVVGESQLRARASPVTGSVALSDISMVSENLINGPFGI